MLDGDFWGGNKIKVDESNWEIENVEHLGRCCVVTLVYVYVYVHLVAAVVRCLMPASRTNAILILSGDILSGSDCSHAKSSACEFSRVVVVVRPDRLRA